MSLNDWIKKEIEKVFEEEGLDSLIQQAVKDAFAEKAQNAREMSLDDRIDAIVRELQKMRHKEIDLRHQLEALSKTKEAIYDTKGETK